MRETGTEHGKPFVRERHERALLNPALVRTGLTKGNPAWTHPQTKVEHSGAVTLLDVLNAEASE